MKPQKYFVVALLLITTVQGHSQMVINSYSHFPDPQIYGYLFNKSNFSTLSGFTSVGFTPTIVNGNELEVIGAASFGRYLKPDWGVTNLNNWTMELIYRPQTTSAGAHFPMIGISPTSSYTPAHYGQLIHMFHGGGAFNGKFRVLSGDFPTFTTKYTSTGTVSYSLNDRIKATIVRSGLTFTYTFQNLSVPDSETLTYTFTTIASVYSWIGEFRIWIYDGTSIFESATVYCPDYKYSRCMFLGDSKTESFIPTTYLNGYPHLVFSGSSKKYVIAAKGNNTFAELVSGLPEILAFHPQYVIINCGSNDLAYGISSATWQANYLSLRNQLVAAGITVIHCLPMLDSRVSVAPLVTYINATFTTDTIIDCNTGFNTGTMTADGFHPNDLGHSFISGKIQAAVPWLY